VRQPDLVVPDPAGGSGNGGSLLLDNLVAFGRALRAVGIPCTPTQIADLARAFTWIDLGDRGEVFRTARALLVTRREDLVLFETVFNRFWRPPGAMGRAAGRKRRRRRSTREPDGFTIATYAAFKARQDLEERDVADRAGTYSDEEVLKRMRFAEMTDDELEEVRRIIGRLSWQAALRLTRRREAHASGPEIDLRRVLRHTGRLGVLPPRLPLRRRREKPRPVVLLADISGSMERYSRLLLQFFHAMVRTVPQVEAFVFGTRLSRVTPQLRLRNPDRALDEVAGEVVDWAGGTRIGACLAEFNRSWSRRVLRRGAVVVVVSDGCDRGRPERLAQQLARLRGRCHRLIWLNPYADHEEYAPRVAGMRAALPYVDDFLPIGDLRSLREFADALARLGRSGRRSPRASGHPVAGSYAMSEDER
jgi:uncharacterized protein with von Willebrand factor type A (vWA) domain